MANNNENAALRNLIAEYHADLLDDCGDWDMAIPASEIACGVIYVDSDEEGQALLDATPGMDWDARRALVLEIAKTMPNAIRNS